LNGFLKFCGGGMRDIDPRLYRGPVRSENVRQYFASGAFHQRDHHRRCDECAEARVADGAGRMAFLDRHGNDSALKTAILPPFPIRFSHPQYRSPHCNFIRVNDVVGETDGAVQNPTFEFFVALCVIQQKPSNKGSLRN
jgi:hypothetical protein